MASNHSHAIAGLVCLANRKGNNRTPVARKVVSAARLKLSNPTIAAGEL